MVSNCYLKYFIVVLKRQENELVNILKYYMNTYTFKNTNELQKAVHRWIDNKEKCIENYGHISYWDTSNICNLNYLFYDNIHNKFINFNEDISRWNTSNVQQMHYTFLGLEKFNQSLNDWDVSKVTSMYHTFDYALSFNQPLDKWDVSSVINMAGMFKNAKSFNQPLNDWNLHNIKNFDCMLEGITGEKLRRDFYIKLLKLNSDKQYVLNFIFG